MNWITILGIIIIAIGTALTYYGSTRQTKNDQKELNDKLDSFNEKLENVISEGSDDHTEKSELEKIKTEFNEWAKGFSKNKEEVKLNYRKSNINLEEKKIRLNKKVHHFYSLFFSHLSHAVDAFNENSSNKITISTSTPLPKNIFDAMDPKFKYQIKFSDSTFWNIELYVSEPVENDNIPRILIYQSNSPDSVSTFFPHLEIDPSSDLERIDIRKKGNFALVDVSTIAPVGDLDKDIRSIITSLIEFQIIELENRTQNGQID